MEKDKFEISWKSLWRILFMAILVVIIFLAQQALIILFLAIIISSALHGPVSYLQRKKIPRILGTLLIFIVVLTILAGVLYTIVPLAIVELQSFFGNFKEIEIPALGTINISQITGIDKYIGNLGDLANILFSGGASFINIITAIFGNMVLILTTLIISFYLTIDQSGVEKFLKTVLPINYENYAVDFYLRARKKMGHWLQGQLILMVIVGVATSIGLWLLGVKYSLLLGVLTGLLEIVPIVGPIFSGALAFVVAISQSWTLGLYVLLLFVFIQQAENHILVPQVMRKTVGVNPVVVVVAILAGAEIAGFIGLILAVPVAVIIQEAIYDYERRKLKMQRLEMS